MTTTYNGWTNKATWLIHCLLENEPAIDQLVYESNESLEQQLADDIKDFVESEISLALAADNSVSWLELANYYSTTTN